MKKEKKNETWDQIRKDFWPDFGLWKYPKDQKSGQKINLRFKVLSPVKEYTYYDTIEIHSISKRIKK